MLLEEFFVLHSKVQHRGNRPIKDGTLVLDEKVIEEREDY